MKNVKTNCLHNKKHITPLYSVYDESYFWFFLKKGLKRTKNEYTINYILNFFEKKKRMIDNFSMKRRTIDDFLKSKYLTDLLQQFNKHNKLKWFQKKNQTQLNKKTNRRNKKKNEPKFILYKKKIKINSI